MSRIVEENWREILYTKVVQGILTGIPFDPAPCRDHRNP